MAFAKCVRCKKLYDQIRSPVCLQCQPEEEADYSKVRDVLSTHPGLTAEDAGAMSGVGLACVLRMLDEGQIAGDSLTVTTKCGQCGAPAIGRNKRLCQACLDKLNTKVNASIKKIREEIIAREGEVMTRRWKVQPASAYKVHEALSGKRRISLGPVQRFKK